MVRGFSWYVHGIVDDGAKLFSFADVALVKVKDGKNWALSISRAGDFTVRVQ